MPKNRKCPTFRGQKGIGLGEWVEVVKAFMRDRQLSLLDKAFFIFDHLGGRQKRK